LLDFATVFSEFANSLILLQVGNKHASAILTVAPALSPIASKLISTNCYEFATFWYAIFRICYSLVFPENGKFPSIGTFSKNHWIDINIFLWFCFILLRYFQNLLQSDFPGIPENGKISSTGTFSKNHEIGIKIFQWICCILLRYFQCLLQSGFPGKWEISQHWHIF